MAKVYLRLDSANTTKKKLTAERLLSFIMFTKMFLMLIIINFIVFFFIRYCELDIDFPPTRIKICSI